MKKNFILSILFCIILITCIILYVLADSDLYYYGKNNLPIYNELPFGMKPEYWNTRSGSPGFKIIDKYDFVHIGRGVRYWGYPNITVDSVISYGFNDTLIIAIIHDTYKNLYCFKQNNTINRFVKLTPYKDCNIEQIKKDYNLKWIENPNNPPYLIMSKRFRSAFVFYISLILFIVYFSKYLKEKHKEKNNNIH